MKEPVLKLSSLTDIIFIFGHKEATDCIKIRCFEGLLLKNFQIEIYRFGIFEQKPPVWTPDSGSNFGPIEELKFSKDRQFENQPYFHGNNKTQSHHRLQENNELRSKSIDHLKVNRRKNGNLANCESKIQSL